MLKSEDELANVSGGDWSVDVSVMMIGPLFVICENSTAEVVRSDWFTPNPHEGTDPFM